MKRLFKAAAFACLFALAACGGRSTPEQQAAASAKAQAEHRVVLAECATFAAAYNLIGAQTGKADPKILEGCPNAPKQGFSFKTISDIKGTINLGRSMTANADDIYATYGDRGVELFRKMIGRGVSGDVARQVAGMPQFSAALQAFADWKAVYG